MASTAAPYGARPVGTLSASGSFNGKVTAIPIKSAYATNIFNGDFVKLAVDGTVQLDNGTTTLDAGLIGIFVGCEFTDPNSGQLLQKSYWPASTVATDAKAFVIDDPNVVFMMQGDAALTQATLHSNVGLVQTAGSTDIGRSKNAIDSSDAAATDTLPIRIVGFVDGPESSVGDDFTDVLCIFNGYHLNLSRFATAAGTGLALS